MVWKLPVIWQELKFAISLSLSSFVVCYLKLALKKFLMIYFVIFFVWTFCEFRPCSQMHKQHAISDFFIDFTHDIVGREILNGQFRYEGADNNVASTFMIAAWNIQFQFHAKSE